MLTWGQSSWGGGVWAGVTVPTVDGIGLAVLIGLSLAVSIFLLDQRNRTKRQEKSR